VRTVNAAADLNPKALRISVDTKATVHVGDYSRGGKSRGRVPVKALDHDMRPKEQLTPGGILEMNTHQAFLFFTASHKTSDFLADGIERWWGLRQEKHGAVERLVINLDNGPECNGRRTQFLQRMVQLADHSGLEIRLLYYPPYHSKYNGIERYWGGLERSWNGYLLSTTDIVLGRAGNFAWKGVRTLVTLMRGVYAKGVKLSSALRRRLEERLQRSERLPFWDITITPTTVRQ
jgi:hypothetical protein